MLEVVRREVFYKVGALKDSTKFTEKLLQCSSFLVKLQVESQQRYWKGTPVQVLVLEFCKILRATFL